MLHEATPFVPSRLVQARERAGMPASALARVVHVTRQTIKNYEDGVTAPSAERVQSLASALNEDEAFFYAPPIDVGYSHEGVFFRDAARNRVTDQKAAGRELEGIMELAHVVLKYVNIPDAKIPSLDVPLDPREIDSAMIEKAAEQLRSYWNLGFEPVRNLTRVAELNGILIQSFVLDYEALDALSIWSDVLERPIVLLNSAKRSAVRSRFDLAHELGHMLLHRSVTPELRSEASYHKFLERQAHQFASALLLPAETWREEVGGVTLKGLLRLKPRWKVSVAAQLIRARSLGMVTEDRYAALQKQLSARGWRRTEPLDETIEAEQPVLIRKATELVAKESPSGLYTVWSQIPRRSMTLSAYAGVAEEFFDPITSMVTIAPSDVGLN